MKKSTFNSKKRFNRLFTTSDNTGNTGCQAFPNIVVRKILPTVTTLVFFFVPFFLFSQAPQGFNYQAVVRDGTGQVQANKNVKIKIGLLQDSPTGTLVWEEEHAPQTNGFGLVNLMVGDDSATYTGGSIGTFDQIDWSTGDYYLQVQVDLMDGNGYQDLGTAQLLSVPFAMFAQSGNEGPQGPVGPQGPEGPQGPAGTGLNNRGSWVSGTTYDPGDYVFDRSTTDPATNSMWILEGDVAYQSTTQPYLDPDHWVEFEAPAGPEGPQGPKGDPGDPATDDQTLELSGNDLTITDGAGTPINMVTLNPDDADADSTNEIQDLQLSSNILTITKNVSPTSIDLSPYLDNPGWNKTGTDTLSYPGSVAVGTSQPMGSKLAVKGDDVLSEKPLFEVKRKDGQTVFAVYNEGVRIYVDDTPTKGRRGGFAIGGFGAAKGAGQEYMRVTPDSIRVYIDPTDNKGRKGGFAIGGYDASKGINQEYLRVTDDSTRIYINNTIAKGPKGGFAIGGFGAAKGEGPEFLRITDDSARIFFNTSAAKGRRGGFAIGGYDASKGPLQEYIRVSEDSVRIYIDDTVTVKGNRGGFAIGGFGAAKGGSKNYFNVSGLTTAEKITGENRILWYPRKNAFLTGRVIVEADDSVGVNSMSSGYETKAIGDYSEAFGYQSTSRGSYSLAIGKNSLSHGNNSFAFGNMARATKDDAFALGSGAFATGPKSFAFGSVGIDSTGAVTGNTIASGENAFALGLGSQASGLGAFAIGANDTASGSFAFALGYKSKASGDWYATAMGAYAEATASYTTAMGYRSKATASGAVALGKYSEAKANGATAMGGYTTASGWYSVAGGYGTTASGSRSVAFGRDNTASGSYATVLSRDNTANGPYSLVGGRYASTGSGGSYSVSWGYQTSATNAYSVAFGRQTTASGAYSVALNYDTEASGSRATAIGYSTVASGTASLAAGTNTSATGHYATALGYWGSTAQAYASLVIGKYNVKQGSTTSWVSTDPLFVAGNGATDATRSNALILYKNGNMTIMGNLTELSDRRTKKNISRLSGMLEKINRINPVSFEFKNKETHPAGKQIGLIAQEVENVFPELVSEGADGYLSVNYTKLTAVLLEAIKEQQKVIDRQDTENREMKERISRLESVIEQLAGIVQK